MTWLPTTSSGETELDRVFGLLPLAYERFRALHDRLWDGDVVSPAVIELCRLRVAMLMRCRSESDIRHPAARDAGLTEEKIEALSRYATSPLFTTLERSCIAFVEQYVMDPHGLTDEDFARLRTMLDDRQIATLALAAATFDAHVRMCLALEISAGATA